MTLYVWQSSVLDAAGNVEPGAIVEVRLAVDNTLATLYEDEAGATPLSNPTATDSDGFVRFYVEGGLYNITAEADAFSVRTWENVLIGAAPSAFSGVQNVTLAAGETLDMALSSSAQVVRLTPNAAGSTLTGIDATGNDRRFVVLLNVGAAADITIPNASASSQLGNRFSNPGGGDMIIPPGGSLRIWLDDGDTDTVWRNL